MLAFYKYILTLVLDIQKLYIYISISISISISIYLYLYIYIYIFLFWTFQNWHPFSFPENTVSKPKQSKLISTEIQTVWLIFCCLHRANKNKSWIQFVKLLICTICIVKLNNTFALFKNASLILNKISQNQVWPS